MSFHPTLSAESNVIETAKLTSTNFSLLPEVTINFNDIFAHICHLQSHYVIFIIAATNNWDIHMVDFKSAYLNAKPTKVIYMRLLPRQEQKGKVAKLEKCLYSTKQAGME